MVWFSHITSYYSYYIARMFKFKFILHSAAFSETQETKHFIFLKTFLLIYHNNNEIACRIATRSILRFTYSVVIYNRWDEQICKWRTDLESLIYGSWLWIIPEVEHSTMRIKAISLAELKMWVIESCARKVAHDFNLSYWFMHVS